VIGSLGVSPVRGVTGRWTVKLRVIVVALPAASVARTLTLCAPSPRPVAALLLALVHALNAPPSSEQETVSACASLAPNSKVTSPEATVSPAPGPAVKATAGAVRSSTNEREPVTLLPTSSVKVTV
jgi:hypothetical protein